MLVGRLVKVVLGIGLLVALAGIRACSLEGSVSATAVAVREATRQLAARETELARVRATPCPAPPCDTYEVKRVEEGKEQLARTERFLDERGRSLWIWRAITGGLAALGVAFVWWLVRLHRRG